MSTLEQRHEAVRQWLIDKNLFGANGKLLPLKMLEIRGFSEEECAEIGAMKKKYSMLRSSVLRKAKGKRPKHLIPKCVRLTPEERIERAKARKKKYKQKLLDDPILKAQQLAVARRAASTPARKQKSRECSLLYQAKLRETHEGRIHLLYAAIRNHAKKKAALVTITEQEMIELTKQPCFYCGASSLIGLDRKNSNGTYELGNVLPCCSTCNLMKGGHLPSVFIERCRDIVRHQRDPFYEGQTINKRSKSDNCFNTWKYKCRYNVSINESTWKKIRAERCFACGVPGPNGIDRINDALPYEIGNLQAACTCCNYAKYQLSNEDFFKQCEIIIQNHPLALPSAYREGACLSCNMSDKAFCYFEQYCCECYYNTFFNKSRRKNKN